MVKAAQTGIGADLGSAHFFACVVCKISLIERLPNQGLYERLPADIQVFGCGIKFLQHGRRKINVYSLNRPHHAPGVGEKPGNVLAALRQARNFFRRHRLPGFTRALHNGREVEPHTVIPQKRAITAANRRSKAQLHATVA